MIKEKIYKTIIIGGGISGLSCARKLYDNEKDFLLITKNIGGRMFSSECFCMNYGAAYMTEDYVNVLKYVEKREPLYPKDFFFFDGKNFKNLFNIKNVKYIPKMVKFIFILKKLRKHFLGYRAVAAHISIKEYFEREPFLIKYWNMSAKDFIKKNGFEELDEIYGNPVTAATAFIESNQVNAFYYIGMFFPVIIKTWVVSFKYTAEKLTDGYNDKIKIGNVKKVERDENGIFIIKSSVGDFKAKNIVFAAPQKALSEVYKLPKPFIQQFAYVFHVRGKRRNIYKNKKAVVFKPKDYDVFMLWKQHNGADIVYSKNSSPNFERYYEKYNILKKIYWNPGMIIPRGEIIEQKFEKNLYLASDYNLSLMEDSFLTGLYAANQIINEDK